MHCCIFLCTIFFVISAKPLSDKAVSLADTSKLEQSSTGTITVAPVPLDPLSVGIAANTVTVAPALTMPIFKLPASVPAKNVKVKRSSVLKAKAKKPTMSYQDFLSGVEFPTQPDSIAARIIRGDLPEDYNPKLEKKKNCGPGLVQTTLQWRAKLDAADEPPQKHSRLVFENPTSFNPLAKNTGKFFAGKNGKGKGKAPVLAKKNSADTNTGAVVVAEHLYASVAAPPTALSAVPGSSRWSDKYACEIHELTARYTRPITSGGTA